MKKFFIRVSAVLAAVAVTAAAVMFDMPLSLTASAAHPNHSVCADMAVCTDPTHTDGHGEVNWSEWINSNKLPASGKYCLTGDVNVKSSTVLTGNLTLCLNGYTVKIAPSSGYSSTTNIYSTGSHTLTICDCSSGRTGTLTGATNTSNTGAIYVNGGTLNMYGGNITGNTGNYGGVYVSNGTFNMYGGTISDNATTKENYSGGGVYCVNSTFNMYGGTISNNTAEYGSGIYSSNGGLNIYGGTISNNNSHRGSSGNCIQINGNTFNMSGGEVINNSCMGIAANSGDLTISGGKISGNNGSLGGIHIYNGTACLAISGGEITNNQPCGIYFVGKTLTLENTVNISGNGDSSHPDLYFAGKSMAVIGEDFTASSPITFDTQSRVDCYKPVTFAENVASDVSDCFKSIHKNYYIKYENGSLKHCCEHTFLTTYEKNDTEHWHRCSDYSYCYTESEHIPHKWQTEVTKEADCTTAGEKVLTCSDCSYSKTETISALGHDLTETKAKAATCTAAGNTAYWTCSRCKKLFKDSAGSTEITKDATVVNAKGHTVVTDSAVAATCEAAGKTAGSHCSVCKTVIVAQKTIAAQGHSWDNGTVTKQPDCTTKGTKTFTCNRSGCGATKTENIDATGHSYASAWSDDENNHWHICTKCNTAKSENAAHQWKTEVTPATCSGTGSEVSACEVCGKVNSTELAIDPDAHNWGAWTIVTEPSLTDKGAIRHTCTRNAGHTADKEIPALNDTSYWTVTSSKDAGCTEDGFKVYTGKDDNVEIRLTLPQTGHSEVIDEAVAATCTTDGKTEGSHCENCGHVFTAQEVISATGHTKVSDPAIPAACMTTGKTEGSHCETCGHVFTAQEVINALGHDWDTEGEVTQKPSCTEKGVKTFTCNREGCNETKTEEIAANGHTEVIDTAVPASCTSAGHGEGSHCSVCNNVINAPEVFPALGHDWDEGSVVTQPDCTEKGVKTFNCLRDGCGETKTEDIPANGHTESTVAAVEPTCTETGLTEGKVCSVCNDVITAQETIAALGHDWGEGVITTPAAEDTEGVMTYTCLRCPATKTEPIAPLGHTHDWSTQWSSNDTYHWYDCLGGCGEKKDEGAHEWSEEVTKQPAAEAEGEKTLTCTVCGFTKTETIPAAGHTEVIDEAVAPTCTETGLTEGSHCSDCGKVFTAQETIPALGHAWDEGVVTTRPTETSDGVMTYTCSRCLDTKTEPIAKLNHTHNWDTEWSKDDTYHWHGCLNSCGEKKDEAIHEWNDGTITRQPTAATAGEKTFECTVCGKTRTEPIPTDTDNGNVSKEVQPGENAPKTELNTPLSELIDAVLAPEEKNEISETGIQIKIVLTVADGTNTVLKEDKAKVEEEINSLSGCRLGQYLDVNLLKIIGDNEEPVTETNGLLRITFEIPARLRGSRREYSVIRVHNGVTDILRDDDNDADTVTIMTDKFSTYALVYNERYSASGSDHHIPTPSLGSPSYGGSHRYPDHSDVSTSESGESEAAAGNAPAQSESETADTDVPANETNEGETADIDVPTSETDESETADTGVPASEASEGETSDSADTPESSDGSSDNSTTSPSSETSPTDEGSTAPSTDENDESSAENTENPSTGIAAALIPLAAVVAIMTAAGRRKKNNRY